MSFPGESEIAPKQTVDKFGCVDVVQELPSTNRNKAWSSVLKYCKHCVGSPMYQLETPTELRILEIYASQEAYESHLNTPHFKKYKTTTLKMVKSLKLIDMNAIDAGTMAKIFRKIPLAQ